MYILHLALKIVCHILSVSNKGIRSVSVDELGYLPIGLNEMRVKEIRSYRRPGLLRRSSYLVAFISLNSRERIPRRN